MPKSENECWFKRGAASEWEQGAIHQFVPASSGYAAIVSAADGSMSVIPLGSLSTIEPPKPAHHEAVEHPKAAAAAAQHGGHETHKR